MRNEGRGVPSCYLFKTRLQEYVQKVKISSPVYKTIKEGPPHEPLFRSTVIVNNARYDSLPGFRNLKPAEQSAAEVALIELAKCGDKTDCIFQPLHELGMCRTALQEYAEKMNFARPTYECTREYKGQFSCTVEFGGIRHNGDLARTKKEAEIKAASAAWLAIQPSSSEMGDNLNEETKYTVVPCKRKDVAKTRKPKKGRIRKKYANKRRKVVDDNVIQAENGGAMNSTVCTEALAVPSGNGSLDVPVSHCQLSSTDEMLPQDGTLNMNQSHGDTSASEGLLILNAKMSDVQPISGNDTTSHGGAVAGHQFGEGNESEPVSMEESKPQDGTPTAKATLDS